MHPLDVIKTRLQIQAKSLDKNDPKYYTGIIDCVKKMSKHEGFFALYKGIIPPILVETPKRAVKVLFNFCFFFQILITIIFSSLHLNNISSFFYLAHPHQHLW